MLHVGRGKQTLYCFQVVGVVSWGGRTRACVFVCRIGYEGLWASKYRQADGTSRRQQRPEALIYHRMVIRHTFFCVRTR